MVLWPGTQEANWDKATCRNRSVWVVMGSGVFGPNPPGSRHCTPPIIGNEAFPDRLHIHMQPMSGGYRWARPYTENPMCPISVGFWTCPSPCLLAVCSAGLLASSTRTCPGPFLCKRIEKFCKMLVFLLVTGRSPSPAKEESVQFS